MSTSRNSEERIKLKIIFIAHLYCHFGFQLSSLHPVILPVLGVFLRLKIFSNDFTLNFECLFSFQVGKNFFPGEANLVKNLRMKNNQMAIT